MKTQQRFEHLQAINGRYIYDFWQNHILEQVDFEQENAMTIFFK